MLDVLRHQDLDGVLATVVRYFGGVKLGAGGLVRAYTDCIAQALKEAEKIPVLRQRTLSFSVPYALEGSARRVIDGAGGTLLKVSHGELVQFDCAIAEPHADQLATLLSDAGQGKLIWAE